VIHHAKNTNWKLITKYTILPLFIDKKQKVSKDKIIQDNVF